MHKSIEVMKSSESIQKWLRHHCCVRVGPAHTLGYKSNVTTYLIFIIKSSKLLNVLQTSESTSNHLLLLPVLAVGFVPI